MKKYLFANIGGSDRAAVADDESGKISIIHKSNGLWFFNELILSKEINPVTQRSAFDGYCDRFQEISQSQFQSFLSGYTNYLNGLL